MPSELRQELHPWGRELPSYRFSRSRASQKKPGYGELIKLGFLDQLDQKLTNSGPLSRGEYVLVHIYGSKLGKFLTNSPTEENCEFHLEEARPLDHQLTRTT